MNKDFHEQRKAASVSKKKKMKMLKISWSADVRDVKETKRWLVDCCLRDQSVRGRRVSYALVYNPVARYLLNKLCILK